MEVYLDRKIFINVICEYDLTRSDEVEVNIILDVNGNKEVTFT